MTTSKNSLVDFKEIITEMKTYPSSFLMYSIPALIIVYLAMFMIYFYNNLDFTDINYFITNIIYLISIVLIYFVCDSFVAHTVYIQYKSKKKLLSVLKESIKTFHIYFVQRLIMLGLIFSPYLALIICVQLISFGQQFFESQLILIIFLLLLLIIFMIVFLFSFYLTLSYSYLPVSTHFTKSKKIFQFKNYNKVVSKKRKSIIIRMLILFAIISLFQLGYMIYDILISFMPENIVSILFQIVGLCITMGISYFSNSYLFFTYKKILSNKKENL